MGNKAKYIEGYTPYASCAAAESEFANTTDYTVINFKSFMSGDEGMYWGYRHTANKGIMLYVTATKSGQAALGLMMGIKGTSWTWRRLAFF